MNKVINITNSIGYYCYRKSYTFEVLASEPGSNPSLTGTATVNIEVLDINDNTPRFNSNNFQFMIYENQPIGTPIGNVSASDRDSGSNAEVCYIAITFTMYDNKFMGYIYRVYSNRTK